jgi:hypothetical protein
MPRTAEPVGSDLLKIDDELSDDERLVRDTVRKFAADRIMPHIADWFEAGTLPKELVPELGQLGLLGMHLEGYGCAGMGPIAYGVTCREMEAADSGLRSLVSVQGALAMFPIWKYGSRIRKNGGCPHGGRPGDRLFRTDRAGPRQRSVQHGDPRRPRRVRLGPVRIEDVDHQRVDRRHRRRLGSYRSRDPWLPRAPRHARLHRAEYT